MSATDTLDTEEDEDEIAMTAAEVLEKLEEVREWMPGPDIFTRIYFHCR